MALYSLSAKGRHKIKLTTLTPFWHRRICEAVAVFCLIIIGLYLWSSTVGLGIIKVDFIVNTIAASICSVAIIFAAISYFFIPQKFQTPTAYMAYVLLLTAVGIINLATGATESPFIATWVVAVIFSGIFGAATLGIVFIFLNVFTVYLATQGQLTGQILLSTILAGELPLLISYILWHGKSSSEKSKEKAYFDLANALDQVANKSDVVIGAINDGVIAINNKGNIELINPAAQRIIGWGKQDALNLHYKTVLRLLKKDGSEIDKAQDPVFEVLTTNQHVKKNDLYLQTTSGKKIMIDIVVSPIGRVGSGVIIVFRDITVEHQKESAQAEFISTASHEMRTPVASIEGYIGLALNPAIATVDAKAREYITKAHESAQHLGRLFQDLLEITKADDGRLSSKPKVINVVEFVNDIAGGLKQKAVDKKLQLIFKPMVPETGGTRNLEPVFFVNVDSDHLREVIANLIDNAIKYTPAGLVVVDVNGDEGRVVISVQDSGIGIPAEDIPHLFQKFYRVDNRDTREIGGTGLGLYLCRRLVETMNGRIWVNSEYKKGSIFYVELERISHEEAIRLIEAKTDQAALSEMTIQGLETTTSTTNLNQVNKSEGPQLDTADRLQINPGLFQLSKQEDMSEQLNYDPLINNQTTNSIVKQVAEPAHFYKKVNNINISNTIQDVFTKPATTVGNTYSATNKLESSGLTQNAPAGLNIHGSEQKT